MASLINYAGIDETFPIAGRDNDSQGFRDNFSIIKNNFEASKGEIEDLQLYVARTDDANDFNGNNLLNYNNVYYTDEVFDGLIVSTNAQVDWKVAPYQFFSLNGNTEFTIYNLPSLPRLAKLRIELKCSAPATSWNVTFNVSGLEAIKKSTRVPATISVTSDTNPIIIELWTYNSGRTIYMDYLGVFS